MLAIASARANLDWWAGWSSIVGLLLTIATVVVSIIAANRAKQAQIAAEIAVKSVRHRETADELVVLVGMTGQMSQFVEVNDGRGASLRAADILEKLMLLENRRLPFLSEETERIELIKEQLSSIAKSLATNGIPTDSAKRAKLYGRCQEVHSVLSSIAGKIQLNLENQSNQ